MIQVQLYQPPNLTTFLHRARLLNPRVGQGEPHHHARVTHSRGDTLWHILKATVKTIIKRFGVSPPSTVRVSEASGLKNDSKRSNANLRALKLEGLGSSIKVLQKSFMPEAQEAQFYPQYHHKPDLNNVLVKEWMNEWMNGWIGIETKLRDILSLSLFFSFHSDFKNWFSSYSELLYPCILPSISKSKYCVKNLTFK